MSQYSALSAPETFLCLSASGSVSRMMMPGKPDGAAAQHAFVEQSDPGDVDGKQRYQNAEQAPAAERRLFKQ